MAHRILAGLGVTPSRRRFALALALVAGAPIAGLTLPARAQSFPSKPVTIVVPFAPGGGTDTLIRIMGPRLSEVWKQPVVIENKPGASGHLGADLVAKAPADGHVLLMGSTAAISEKNVDKFAAVSLVSAYAYVIVVNPNVPVRNLSDLIAYAKQRPGQVKFGSSGVGAASHLSGELFKSMAGVDLLHVPYKGTGQAVTDLLGGHIQLMFAPTQTVLQHVKTGKLRALGVTGTKPEALLPEVPTAMAAGVAGYTAQGWFGLLAPRATPAAIVQRLNADIQKVMAMTDIRERLLATGAEPGTLTSAEFDRFVRDEQDKWARLMKANGIVVE